MRIYSQWKFHSEWWGISLLTVFRSQDFVGVTILGFVIEWPISELGRAIDA